MPISEVDPRFKRSRDCLRAALIQIVTTKNFAELTIKEVTDLAGLNRATFYLHYTGLHELLEDCAFALFSELREDIYATQSTEINLTPTASIPYIEKVFHHLEKHEKFYGVMLGRQGDPLFRVLFGEFLSELIFEPILIGDPQPKTNQSLEMVMQFFSSGFTGIAEWWLEKGRPITAEQASREVALRILPDYIRLLNL